MFKKNQAKRKTQQQSTDNEFLKNTKSIDEIDQALIVKINKTQKKN